MSLYFLFHHYAAVTSITLPFALPADAVCRINPLASHLKSVHCHTVIVCICFLPQQIAIYILLPWQKDVNGYLLPEGCGESTTCMLYFHHTLLYLFPTTTHFYIHVFTLSLIKSHSDIRTSTSLPQAGTTSPQSNQALCLL